MGVFEEVAERIPGLVRVICQGASRQDIDEIAQRVLKKLLGRLSVSYVWSVVHTTWLDYLKEKGPTVPLPDAFDPPAPTPSRDQKVPFAVVVERLRIVDEAGGLHALAFNYHTHLDYTPEQIAINLAAVPLEDLARSFVKRFAVAAESPETQVEPYFANILALGKETFQDRWRPAAVVDGWIEQVQAVVSRAAPPGLQAAASEPPNRRVVYALGSRIGLGHTADHIVAAHGKQTLEYLQTDFEAQYRAKVPPVPIPLDAWKPVLQVNGEAAARELQSYYTPTRTIGKWLDHIRHRLDSEERKQEKLGLREIFNSRRYSAAECMAFLYTHDGFIGMHPNDVWRAHQPSDLLATETELRAHYIKKSPFEREAIERWFESLNGALESRPFLAVFPTTQAVRDSAKKVLNAVRPKFQGGAQLPLFGWRHKLL